ncbi:MFS transporter [Actinokineospora sp. NBRC 105648]|uniref:MFS transporter n=1 Tax=Actinokineospora sp. NBRC 105648 TaxID=3032206 RepID=UPI0024A32DC3|nr:MFS transporter [Actinokineospora sp. NBRC 105648]GLZ43357.1 MFS transporter [Actinokineospora sp. NBRC 105648]
MESSLGRDFWRLWIASSLSNLADGVLKVALPLVAIGYTRSPALIAGLTFAFTLPWLVFALPAGVLADRFDRRRAMLLANITRAALLTGLTLLVAFDAGSIWVLYVVVFLVGITETVHDTAAQSIVPQLVDRDHLSVANSRLYGAELTANQFVGPPVAGLLAAAGATVAFGAPAGLWIIAVAAMWLVRGNYRPAREQRTTLRADVVEGLRFLWRLRLLRTFAISVGIFNFASNAAMSVLVLFAVGPQSSLGLSEQEFGLLLTTMALGSLAGSFAASWVQRVLGRAKALAACYLLGAVLIGMPALTTNVWVIGAGSFAGGIGIVVSNVIMVSLRQRITPDRLLGRVNSGYRLVAWGTMPLGAAAGGVLAQFVGLRAVFGIMGVLALTLLAVVARVSDAAMDEAERVGANA